MHEFYDAACRVMDELEFDDDLHKSVLEYTAFLDVIPQDHILIEAERIMRTCSLYRDQKKLLINENVLDIVDSAMTLESNKQVWQTMNNKYHDKGVEDENQFLEEFKVIVKYQTTNPTREIEKDLKIVKDFKAMIERHFDDDYDDDAEGIAEAMRFLRADPLTNYYVSKFVDQLILDLERIKNKTDGTVMLHESDYYKSRPTKTPLKQLIDEILNKYKIKGASLDAKQFIDSIN